MKLRGRLTVSENIKFTLFFVELFWIPFIKIKNTNNIIVAELVLLINILSAKSAHINICTGSTVAGS